MEMATVKMLLSVAEKSNSLNLQTHVGDYNMVGYIRHINHAGVVAIRVSS